MQPNDKMRKCSNDSNNNKTQPYLWNQPNDKKWQNMRKAWYWQQQKQQNTAVPYQRWKNMRIMWWWQQHQQQQQNTAVALESKFQALKCHVCLFGNEKRWQNMRKTWWWQGQQQQRQQQQTQPYLWNQHFKHLSAVCAFQTSLVSFLCTFNSSKLEKNKETNKAN